METKLFYMIEDDYNVSSIYSTKKPWLESLRYNLDVCVEEDDFSQEESDERYQKAEANATDKLFEVNGFYYSVQEVKVVYQNDKLIIRYNDYNKEIMFYTFNGESYDFQEEDVISEFYDEVQIFEVLKGFIKDEYFDIAQLARTIKNVLEGK